jgi:DNA-binding helix-hairpin-helix protein with protein kinase domain
LNTYGFRTRKQSYPSSSWEYSFYTSGRCVHVCVRELTFSFHWRMGGLVDVISAHPIVANVGGVVLRVGQTSCLQHFSPFCAVMSVCVVYCAFGQVSMLIQQYTTTPPPLYPYSSLTSSLFALYTRANHSLTHNSSH